MAKKQATAKPAAKKTPAAKKARQVVLAMTPVPFVKIFEVTPEPVHVNVATTIKALVRKDPAHTVKAWVIDLGTDAEPPADDEEYDPTAGANGVYSFEHTFAAARTYIVRVAIMNGSTVVASDSIDVDVQP